MRTTTKRGLGRGADLNGNGRAVLPPGTQTPVTRYRQPEPERSRLPLPVRIVLWTIVAVLVVAVGLAGGAYLFFNKEFTALRAHTPDLVVAQKKLDAALPGQPTIALVVGYDHRANEAKSDPSRSDTIMLVRADPQAKAISLLSFPRDLIVPVQCPGHAAVDDRINSAYARCGARGSLLTLKNLTGLPVNYLITVNFHGFKDIVDKVGGVWIDVDHRYYNRNVGTAGTDYANIDLQPGYQKLNGQQALDYVRYRHTDSDVVRTARQQQFVKALKAQLANNFSPFGLPGLIGAVTRNVEIGVGGAHPLQGKTILSYLLFAYGLPAGHVFQTRIENLQQTGIGGAELTAPPREIQSAVRDFTTPDVNAPKSANVSALGLKVRQAAPPPSATTVIALNGNGEIGAAANASYALAQRGYKMIAPPNGQKANAPTFDYFHSKVYYDPARPVVGKAAAQKVANLLGDTDVESLPAGIDAYGALLAVVVGRTFHGAIAPAPVEHTPKHVPPAVTRGPDLTRALVHDAQRRLPFRVLAPTVLERSSYLDRAEPTRVYRIGHHRAVRFVFRTGQGEFWGVEETDWANAPVLNGPNFHHRFRGRTYDLYYSGPHLHMVVLRQGQATYWVVNTLLDSISNETMLAIAQGLQTSAK